MPPLLELVIAVFRHRREHFNDDVARPENENKIERSHQIFIIAEPTRFSPAISKYQVTD